MNDSGYMKYDENMVVNYDEDTLILKSHCDTTIGGKHIVIDTIQKNDTIYVETHTYEKEIELVEKLIEHPDFGKGLCSIFILVFVVISVWKKWKCKNK
jgi:hypothetical protein